METANPVKTLSANYVPTMEKPVTSALMTLQKTLTKSANALQDNTRTMESVWVVLQFALHAHQRPTVIHALRMQIREATLKQAVHVSMDSMMMESMLFVQNAAWNVNVVQGALPIA